MSNNVCTITLTPEQRKALEFLIWKETHKHMRLFEEATDNATRHEHDMATRMLDGIQRHVVAATHPSELRKEKT